jgi:hypothetical protein
MTRCVIFESDEEAVRVLTGLGAVVKGQYVEPGNYSPTYPTTQGVPLNGFCMICGTIHTVNEDFTEVAVFQDGVISALAERGYQIKDTE